MLLAVIKDERIVTTTSRAKYLRGKVDRLITWGKRGTLFDKRLAYQVLGNHTMVTKLFDGIAPRFPKVQGGYTRVLRAGTRKGDGASLSLLELTKVEKKRKTSKVSAVAGKASANKIDKASSEKEKKPAKGIASRVKKIFKKENEKREKR